MAEEKLQPQRGQQPSPVDVLKNWWHEHQKDQPALGGQFAAWVREGAKDLQNVVLRAFPDSMALTNEPGAPGSPTPQMVTRDLDQTGDYNKMLESYAARAQQSREQDRGLER
jgi:hypothetical protein